jgi:hypothetical protein
MGVIFGGETKEGTPVPGVRTVNTNRRKDRGKAGHVVLIPGVGTFFCAHCGEAYTPSYPIAVPLMTAMTSAFGKAHKKCELTNRGAACTLCLGFGHDPKVCPRLGYNGDPHAWWSGPDTGMSSKTIWRVLMGHPATIDVYEPADPADFGRCHRLLHAIPGWRARIGEMARVRGWEHLAPAWDELEALYVEELPSGRAPKLYKRMAELRAMPSRGTENDP